MRGRGGAGFPTGRKWESVRNAGGPERFVVVNAAEGEPGTFKDRPLLRRNPYQVIEGLLIAAHAISADRTYIGLKASFTAEQDALVRALGEMAEDGILGDTEITVVPGPEEYLFGEETGLLEVIEGEDPLPRNVPPYLYGLFATRPQLGWSAVARDPEHDDDATGSGSNPTLVNNVETLANVPRIIADGVDAFRARGTAESPGTIVCTVSGATRRAGFGEVEMGTPLRWVLDELGGGLPDGHSIKCVLSGISNPVITAAMLDTELSYEAMQAAGTGLGSAGFMVYDDTTDAADLAYAAVKFLHVESCGQCPPCKWGTGEVQSHLRNLLRGRATDLEVEVMAGRLAQVTDASRCYLPREAQLVVASLLEAYPEEFAATPTPRPRAVAMTKIVDIVDGEATFDERQALKRPDWTYRDG